MYMNYNLKETVQLFLHKRSEAFISCILTLNQFYKLYITI